MQAREARLPEAVRPVIWDEGSDSTSLDEALHLLERSGRNVLHALSVLMPTAWEGNAGISPAVQDFYRYHAPIIEPWDGPAGLAFSDGRYVGAALDRNGLRPCRYNVTAEGLVVAGSEVGAIELDDYRIVEKGRLGPGQMLALDLERHQILHDHELKRELAAERPWGSWIMSHAPQPRDHRPGHSRRGGRRSGPLQTLQRAHGYSSEDLKIVLRPMGAEAQDAVWSMGDDTPIAPFARAPRPVYAFFRQRFAQVTNPPIDPLRESLVMSLRTWLGPKPGFAADRGPAAGADRAGDADHRRGAAHVAANAVDPARSGPGRDVPSRRHRRERRTKRERSQPNGQRSQRAGGNGVRQPAAGAKVSKCSETLCAAAAAVGTARSCCSSLIGTWAQAGRRSRCCWRWAPFTSACCRQVCGRWSTWWSRPATPGTSTTWRR